MGLCDLWLGLFGVLVVVEYGSELVFEHLFLIGLIAGLCLAIWVLAWGL